MYLLYRLMHLCRQSCCPLRPVAVLPTSVRRGGYFTARRSSAESIVYLLAEYTYCTHTHTDTRVRTPIRSPALLAARVGVNCTWTWIRNYTTRPVIVHIYPAYTPPCFGCGDRVSRDSRPVLPRPDQYEPDLSLELQSCELKLICVAQQPRIS